MQIGDSPEEAAYRATASAWRRMPGAEALVMKLGHARDHLASLDTAMSVPGAAGTLTDNADPGGDRQIPWKELVRS